MKKRSWIWLFAIMGLAALIGACQKDDRPAEQKTNPERQLVGGNDALIEKRILQFVNTCEAVKGHSVLKNSECLCLKEALWLMESAMNYMYGYPNMHCENPCRDTCVIDLAVSGIDTTSMVNIANAFNTMHDSLVVFYNQVAGQNKKVKLIDLIPLTSSNPSVHGINCIFEVGDETNPPGFWYAFGETDYWFWAYQQGKCGPYLGQGFGSDAILEMMKHKDFFLHNGYIPDGYNVYYTDVYEIGYNNAFFNNPRDTTPNDNYYDKLLFYNNINNPNYHECLDPMEMNIYFNNIDTVLWHICYPNWVPYMTYWVVTFHLYPSAANISASSVIQHNLSATYGIPHFHYDPSYPKTNPGS